MLAAVIVALLARAVGGGRRSGQPRGRAFSSPTPMSARDTPLIAAARRGRAADVVALLNVNEPKENGVTALFISCQEGHRRPHRRPDAARPRKGALVRKPGGGRRRLRELRDPARHRDRRGENPY